MASARTTARCKAATALLAILLTCSCTGDTLQQQYRHIPAGEWRRDDTLCFDIPPATRDGLYTTDIEIRTSAAFPYRKLWLAMEFSLSDSSCTDSICPCDTVHRDTVCIATQEDSRTFERKGMAVPILSYSHNSPTLKKGQYGQLKVFHLMSRESLPDILDVGIRIKPRRPNDIKQYYHK